MFVDAMRCPRVRNSVLASPPQCDHAHHWKVAIALSVQKKSAQPSLSSAAMTFVEQVEETGLAGLLRAYGTSGTRKDALLRDRPSLSPDLGLAVDLLCLSRPVSHEAAVTLLTEPLLDHLLGMGAASASGDQVELSKVRLIEHFGGLVFVSTVNNTGFGYYGRDSIGL